MSALVLSMLLHMLVPAKDAAMRAELVGRVHQVMLAAAPPGRSKIRDAVETEEQGRARYGEIAEAIVEAADGNRRAVSLLMSIALHESGYRRDVDLGIGPLARGDGGRSCTAYQLNLGRGPRCDALLADRVEAAREALRLARRSFARCRRRPMRDRLAVYTAGDCALGGATSRVRIDTAERFLVALNASDVAGSSTRIRVTEATRASGAHVPSSSDSR